MTLPSSTEQTAAFKAGRMHSALEESDYDAVLAVSVENVYYLSAAWIITQRLIPERLAVVLWPRQGDPSLLVCSIEETLARGQSSIRSVHAYEEFAVSPVQAVVDLVVELGLEHGHLGVELRTLTAHYFAELEAALPSARFSSCEPLFDRVRMVKSREEIELLARAAAVTDAAIWEAWAESRVGETEAEIAGRMRSRLLDGGADSLAFLVLGAGETAKQAHPSPRPVSPRAGDVLRVDFGGQFDGYYSDLARTAAVGSASSRQRTVYAQLWESQQAVIELARPGARPADLFERCREEFERRGLNFFMPHIGHGLGVGLHEQPMLNRLGEEPLEEGMVLAIEPYHREPDGTLYHIEDLVVVEPAGPRVVSRAGRWDTIPVIG
jgi:Xaa-Pro aminopeptidase